MRKNNYMIHIDIYVYLIYGPKYVLFTCFALYGKTPFTGTRRPAAAEYLDPRPRAEAGRRPGAPGLPPKKGFGRLRYARFPKLEL